MTKGLIKSKSICIAYETVTDENNRLPLLAPMSAVAGRMSVQAGAHCLEKNQSGRGLLLGGAPGVTGGNVVILGGGVVGENAAAIASGMEAKVHIVDKSESRLEELQKRDAKNQKIKVDPIKAIREMNAMGKYQEAVDMAEKVAKEFPGHAKLHTWWGISLVKLKNTKEASEHLFQ